MSATINPEIRDLQQKIEEVRITLAKTQGEIEIIKHNSERNDKQTTKQFVPFFIGMLIAVVGSLVGTSIFQTDALRREMSVRFDAVNQRMERIEKSIDELKEEIQSQRNSPRR